MNRSALSIVAISTIILTIASAGYAGVASFQGLGDLPGGSFLSLLVKPPHVKHPLTPSESLFFGVHYIAVRSIWLLALGHHVLGRDTPKVLSLLILLMSE